MQLQEIEQHYKPKSVDDTVSKIYYVDSLNRKQGGYIEKYGNGRSKIVCFYKDGKLSGPYMEFNREDQLLVKATYKNGVLHGKLQRWSTTGNLIEVYYYENGKRVSSTTVKD